MTHQVNDELYLAAFSWSRSQALNGNVPTLYIKQEIFGQCIAWPVKILEHVASHTFCNIN